jgi:hypothetical protein
LTTFQRFNLAEFRERQDLEDERFDAAVTLIAPSPEGPWLVGGSVRRLLLGMDQDSDFDVAFPDAKMLEKRSGYLQALGFKVTRETDEHMQIEGMLENRKTVIQLLRVAYAPKPEGVLDTFDFTICQFAFDGTELVCGPYSLWDLGRKRLAIHRVTFAASTVRRFMKYSKQGFKFCQGTIVAVLESVIKDPALVRADMKYVD